MTSEGRLGLLGDWREVPPPHTLALQWCLIYVCSLFSYCRLLFAHHEIANSAIWGLGAKSLSQSRLAERKCDGCRSAESKRDHNSPSPKTTYNQKGRRLKDVWDYGLISWAVQNICHHENKISITIWSRVLNEEHSSQSSKRMLSGGSYCGFCLCLVVVSFVTLSVVVSQMSLCDVICSSSPLPPSIFHLTVSCQGITTVVMCSIFWHISLIVDLHFWYWFSTSIFTVIRQYNSVILEVLHFARIFFG